MKTFSQSQNLMDEIVRCCARDQISAEALNLALLSMLYTAMKTEGAESHNLADDDGVCLMHVRRYE